MNRRARGTGSVFKRKGRWVAALAFPDGGKRERTARTQREAIAKLRELEEQAAAEQVAPASQERAVGAYVQGWLNRSARQWKHTSESNYRMYEREHVRPYALARVPIAELRDRDVEHWLADLTAAKVSAAQQQKVFGMLHRVVRDARKRRILIADPMELVARPRPPKKPARYLTAAQMETFLGKTSADPRVHALAVLLAYSGLRIGEALGLTWRDIDFDAGTLKVQRTLTERRAKLQPGEDFFVLHEPKTQAGTRTVSLPASALAALRQHRVLQSALVYRGALPHPDRPVFASGRGGWLRQTNVLRRWWHPACARAKLPLFGFHALRHSHASVLLSQKHSLASVAKRLGHADGGVTSKVYAHALPHDDDAAAALVEQAFGEAPAATVAEAPRAGRRSGKREDKREGVRPLRRGVA